MKNGDKIRHIPSKIEGTVVDDKIRYSPITNTPFISVKFDQSAIDIIAGEVYTVFLYLLESIEEKIQKHRLGVTCAQN